MNLITAFNGFADWEDTNTLSDKARSLYISLLQFANRAGWPEELSIPTNKLIARTPGIKANDRKTFGNYRDELEREGLIIWRSRKGRQSAVYEIIDLCGKINPKKETQPSTQSTTQTETQPSTQSTTIYIKNKEKENNNNNSNSFLSHEETMRRNDVLNHLEFEARRVGLPWKDDSDFDYAIKLEGEYSLGWLLKAIPRIAGRSENKRDWRYVEGILRNWKDQGGPDGEVRESKVVTYERKVLS